MSRESRTWARIAKVMQDGGYFDAVMSGGSELDRVKEYILAFAGQRDAPCAYPLQRPGYPCFPGLRHAPFRDDTSAAPGTPILEDAFQTIRDEYLRLKDDDYAIYGPPDSRWMIHFLYHMGVDLEPLTKTCPRTFEIVRGLPRVCLDYPWGDALFSVHTSDAHLAAHCSIDNLRIRCHLGIQVPSGCEMRVGTEIRGWQEGKGLIFEDSFEHEVWNRGTARRAVLIVDFWHPDLTDAEIRALTAGFRKSEVRQIFFLQRIQNVSNSKYYIDYLQAALQREDDDALLSEYWNR
jgi:Aspartyl/Asparaginyl beta-hydroxylase